MNKHNNKMLLSRLKTMKAGEIMSRFAITTAKGTPLTEVAHLMSRFKISGVPVVDKNKEICGVVTATDLFRVLNEITNDAESENSLFNSDNIVVDVIMTKEVYSVTEETSLYDIIKLMGNKNIHTLPVISDKEIIGIIGRRDVLNASYAVMRTQS